MSEDNPSEAVGGEGVNAPAPGTENVTPAASLKDIVKQATGREYPSDEEALKGIKETYSMVGKKIEPQVVEKTVVPEDVVQTVKNLEQRLKVSDFYASHPEYKVAEGLINDFGGDPEQVVAKPGFKQAFEALKQVSETGNRSVLSSNSRLGIPNQSAQDYSKDLAAMRSGEMPVAVFMDKHKGVPMPKEGM